MKVNENKLYRELIVLNILRKIKTTNNQTNKQINGTNAVPHTNKE